MADYPDIYADGVGIGIGAFGVTVTFQLSQPTMEVGPHVDPSDIVCRVRMTPALAKVLAQGLNDALAQQANVQQAETTTIKH
jgi:hypothetical protein